MFTQRHFNLKPEEYDKIKKWANNHKCSCRCGDKASLSCCGGEISITFTPTALGIAKSAHCICGETLELSSH